MIASGDDVHGYVERVCFKTGPPRLLGAEIEFLLTGGDPSRPVPLSTTRAALEPAAPLPGGSAITFEPGGQVELSSPPATSLSTLLTDLGADVDALVAHLALSGLGILDTAVDPIRPPHRQLSAPRYDAMEFYFDGLEPELDACDRVGRAMMCSTSSVQVNLDAGLDPAFRWRLLHDLGPTLIAAFANSPQRCGAPTGWRSSRQLIWQQLDPRRTAAPALCGSTDPVAAYAEFALDAPVMLPIAGAVGGRTLRDTVERGLTESDLEAHLSTLFPPVRPRGFFEVRYLDAPPLRWWQVPVAVLAALLDTTAVAEEAADLVAPAQGRWTTAAREGLDDPTLRETARRVMDLVVGHLHHHHPAIAGLVDDFADRYTRQGRCPADDPIPSAQELVL